MSRDFETVRDGLEENRATSARDETLAAPDSIESRLDEAWRLRTASRELARKATDERNRLREALDDIRLNSTDEAAKLRAGQALERRPAPEGDGDA